MAEPQSPKLEERVARLEAKIEGAKWWRNPGWLSLILTAFLGVSGLLWQTKPWELLENDEPKTVRLIEGRASAFAKNQWDANLRVVNETSRDIVVERVKAVFGKSGYGRSCRRKGQATRLLYPVPQQQGDSRRSLVQRIRPGEGALFEGGPNIDGLFGSRRPCPLPVKRFHIPSNKVHFTVFTTDGADWRGTGRLFYQPRARVSGGGGYGGGGCFLPLLPIC